MEERHTTQGNTQRGGEKIGWKLKGSEIGTRRIQVALTIELLRIVFFAEI